MKKTFVILTLMIASSQLFAQTDAKRVHSDITISKRTIHIDTDETGNDLVFIPTSPPPTVLSFDAPSQTYKAVKGKVKSSQGSIGGKSHLMHKPFIITKESDKTFKKTADENGDIDVSAFEDGTYLVSLVEKKQIKFSIKASVLLLDNINGLIR